jgi:hypothetical protein
MENIYSAHGIRFAYPGDWELTEDVDQRDVVV